MKKRAVNSLIAKNLKVRINDKVLLKGINLKVEPGEIHAIFGPNGSGKTTLAMSVMGKSNYKLSGGLNIGGKNMLTATAEKRSVAGIFLSFQNPVEIPGVSVFSFLRTSFNSLYPDAKIPISDFKKNVIGTFIKIGLSEEFLTRSVNENFSGGERKKFEIAQVLILKPKFAILDEIDSGLDIDSIKKIGKILTEINKSEKTGLIIISHNLKIFDFIKPQYVHILDKGEIKKTGGNEIIREIEKYGYQKI